MDGWRPSDVSDICYGSQRRITIVGTAMNHGRHLAGIGLERFGNGKDVRLLAKASPQRSRRVWFSQCQEMCTRRRTASFHSFSDESVDSTSLKRRANGDSAHRQQTRQPPLYALQERSQYMFSCIVNFLTLWRIKNTVAANGQIDTINGLH